MPDWIHQLQDYMAIASFQRALIAGVFIALTCSLLGLFLVLRRYAMIGHGLAHVSFGTVGLGLMLHASPAYAAILAALHLEFLLDRSPLYIMVPLVMLSSLWILHLAKHAKAQADAAIGMVSALGIAVGVILASVGGGFSVDLKSYLFGSIIAIRREEVVFSVILCAVVLVLVVCFFHDLFTATFDPEFAEILGVRTDRITRLLILCTALTITLGIRIVGALLISSLIVFPAMTALQLARSFRKAIVLAALSAVAAVILGMILALLHDFPPGATIVLVNFAFFAIAYLIGKLRRD